MKVDNYKVAMNAQYYNLQLNSTNAKISNTREDFNKDSSERISAISPKSEQIKGTDDELSRELSKAILKNINNHSERLIGDRVEISTLSAESQALNFSVNAFVQADGKEISLSLDVSLSRTFVQKTTITRELNNIMKDPLVISLDGTMPSLSSNTFNFDIDNDGKSDQISQLNAGSAFLALDKNSNGVVDNGSELFGTKSGDGFSDLRKYDDDNNGWIDENDPIFDKLQIWQKSDGKDKLIGLGEVGIGAIFLGNTDTPFSIKSGTNALLGQLRKSGFVLFEDGKAGIMSQIDLAVSQETKEGLNKIDSLQKNFNSSTLYPQNAEEQSSDTSDEKMKKLQGEIKSLESTLRRADDDQKAGIQARIGALQAQMMAILESKFT